MLAPAAPQESANQTADDGADEIVVSGSRIRSKADARVDAPSPAPRKQASPSLERLGSAIARNPGSANAYLDRALFLRRQGDLVAARADLDAAHRLDPRDANILRERSRIRRLLGDIRGAEIDEAAAVAAGG